MEHDEETTYDVYHGWEVMQFVVEGYDTNRRFGQRDHNIRNIAAAMTQLMAIQSRNPMPQWDEALKQLVSYALLDGLVGNTDRHHENWMIAYGVDFGAAFIAIMPSYDHASSLGRELTDEKRCRILESHEVRRYLERGRGAVYVDSRRNRAPSPLRLARLLCRWIPEFTTCTLDRIHDLPEADIRAAVERVPRAFMSDVAKEFACQVIMTGRHKLLRSAR